MKIDRKAQFFLSVLCILIVFCGNLSAGGNQDFPLYDKKSAFNDNVYYARSSSQISPQKELTECLFNVARQISIRQQIYVQCIVTSETRDDGTKWKKSTVVTDFDQNNSIDLLDKMTVLEILQSNKGTEALIQVSDSFGFIHVKLSPSSTLGKDKNPGWIKNPPKGSRFYAAIGSQTQNSERIDGFNNSDTNAYGAISMLVSKPIVSGNTSMYETVLKGVYIARRWYNPSENRYYSLAILPR